MRFVILVVTCLLLTGGVSAQTASDVELAKKLYGVFLSIPTRPEILKGSDERKRFEYIAKIASDPSDGVDKVGVEHSGSKATLWLLTKEAEMSGRMALYTLHFVRTNDQWCVVSGSTYMNGPTAMPKNIVSKCTLSASMLSQ